MRKFLLAPLFLFGSFIPAFCGNVSPDQLKKIAEGGSPDTARTWALLSLGNAVYLQHPDSALHYWKRACALADTFLSSAKKYSSKEGLTLKHQRADALANIGYIYRETGESLLAIDYDLKSIDAWKAVGDSGALATAYNNLAIVYDDQGNIPEAIGLYQKALEIRKRIGDETGLAFSYNTLGYVYTRQMDYDLALEFYRRSLAIRERTNDIKGQGVCLNNIGLVYRGKHDTASALEYFTKSLAKRELAGDRKGAATSMHNIALIYLDRNELDRAEVFCRKGIALRRSVNDRQALTVSYKLMGDISYRRHNDPLAVVWYDSALALAKKVGLPENIRNAAEPLVKVFREEGKFQEALAMHELFITMRDCVNNEANRKAVLRQQVQFEFDRKADSLRADADKREVIAASEKHRQTIVRNSLIAGIALMLALAFVLFRSYRNKKKANDIISQQKSEVEEQKQLVEEKNKEVLDSIRYARRIQRALLASHSLLEKNLREHFIFYRPKDIVSGDFYWAALANEGLMLCAADCTGHGVPGAFMSLLNISFLNEAVLEKNITDPSMVLGHVRSRVIQSLAEDEAGGRDGMDAVICCLGKNEVRFSCANNALLLVREGKIKEFAPDKFPVGKHDSVQQPFTLYREALQNGDVLYLFTDGYADQFGGPSGKKFKYKQFYELLLSIHTLPMEDQSRQLEKKFGEWKGRLEQVDDVLVIGVRI
ncbi:MAG TPA: tetratricopeptide repeat protein [Bacteroidia bacterium]|jgi:serine phosphatase RsbU (regulator of sigma subunit)/Tfp pilus assembly protein PilF